MKRLNFQGGKLAEEKLGKYWPSLGAVLQKDSSIELTILLEKRPSMEFRVPVIFNYAPGKLSLLQKMGTN